MDYRYARRPELLISIKPKYADMIMAGSKIYEYRRTRLSVVPESIFIYVTAPVSMLVGYAHVDSVGVLGLRDLWHKTKDGGGITKQEFDEYFTDTDRGTYIKIRCPRMYPMTSWHKVPNPPQSFRYVWSYQDCISDRPTGDITQPGLQEVPF